MLTGDVTLNQSVMAIGAHADDIEINAGGTLEKYFHLGYEVVYVMSTNNMSGHVSTIDAQGKRTSRKEANDQMMARRKRECDVAAAEWNTQPIHLDHPQRHYTDQNLQQVELRYGSPVPEAVDGDVPSILTACEDKASIDRLKKLILQKNPEVILTHHIADTNPEHYGTALLVAKAYWAAFEEGFKGALLLWQTPYTIFGPFVTRWETYVDYTPYLDRKMELIGKHACQMPHWQNADFGHRILSMEYGKATGCGAAEVFTWVNRSSHMGPAGPAYGSLMIELLNRSH